MSPDHDRLVPGTIVGGKLRVVAVIGVGGMGTVYEVEHELTKHRRALKILHAGAPAGVVERFVREASAAGRIGNPHVAETFDAGRFESGEPYLLMELLDGETLDHRLLRTGPIDPGELADLVHQACDGIQAAHDAGIVHRDLKPENVFITTRDGAPFVKILDFGISKFDEGRTGALGITEEGSVMGTPYYMSPEQVCASTSIDARTDIYALGVMLYECACGERPYDGSYLGQLAVLIHQGKATPLGVRRPSLGPSFCDVVHRAMAVDRDQRFPTARDLADALGPFRRPNLAAPPQRGSAPPQRVTVRPAPQPGASASSMTPLVPSTDAALAATMASQPPEKIAHRRSRRATVVAVVLVATSAALFGAFVGFGPARERSLPAASTAVAPIGAGATSSREPARDEPQQVAPSASLSPPAVSGAPIAGLPPASSIRDAGAAVEMPRPARSASAPPARPSPSVSKPGPSRADQKGLAGENPFQ
jgi:serine/threonine protein kinase